MDDSSVSGLVVYADAGMFSQQIGHPMLGGGFDSVDDGFGAIVRFCLVGSSAAVHLRVGAGTFTRSGKKREGVGEHILALVVRGEGILTVGEVVRPLPPDAIVVVDGGLDFRLTVSAAGAGDCEVDWLQLGGPRPPALTKAPGFVVMTSALMTEYVIGQARLVQPAEDDIGPFRRDIPVLDYIGAAIRDRLAQMEAREGPPSRDARLYQRITAFIGQAVKTPGLGADLLVRRFGISKRKLYGVFYANGASLHETIMTARLEAARRELEAGGQKVTNVITDYGFTNPSTFYRNYRRHFGGVPRAR